MPRIALLLTFALLLSPTHPARAQEYLPSHCIALSDRGAPETVWKAGFRDPLPDQTVRLSYVGHSMVLLQTPAGHSVVTDYAGHIGTADFVPEVATMNRAHSTHWTASPDPRIPHVLPGWNPDGGPAEHYLELDELLVRNVTTDIRSGNPAAGKDGNSIFIFEVAGLCIGHLGHLHHEPTPEQYAAIGRLDVVMAPVDGGMTLDLPSMIRVLQRLRSSVVIPIHWFGPATLEVFLAGMAGEFDIDRTGETSVELSLQTLPPRPTVVVLDPAYLSEND